MPRQVPAYQRMQDGINARRGIVQAPAERVVAPTSAAQRPHDAVVDRIASARRAGASDEEIVAVLAETYPQVASGVTAGAAPEEIIQVIAETNTGQPYFDQGRARGDEAQLGMAADARAARAEQAAGPQGFARAGRDLIAPGRAAAEMLIEGQKQTQQGGIGSYAAGQAKSAGGAFLLALSPVTGPLNVGRAEIERRVEATGAPGVLGTLPFDAASMAIPLSAPVKMANALKGAGAVAGRTSKTAADLIAARLAAGLTEEQKLGRAIATARPRTVRPVMRPQAEALRSHAINESTNAERVAQEQSAALADALRAHQDALRAAGPNTTLGVGASRSKSARGADVRENVDAAHQAIIDSQRANDDILRDLQKEISDEAQSSGKSVADLDDAKALLREAKDALNPPLGTTRDVSGPLDKEALTIYDEIAQALRQREVVVSHADALTAAAQGDKVRTIPPPARQRFEVGGEPTYIRTFKTSFDALDTLRRRLGQSFGQEMEGFSAISNEMRRGLATRIDDLLTQFVGDVHPELQANWRNGMQARGIYEEGLGKAITGLAGDTAIPAVSANKLPARIIGEGAEGLQKYKDMSGSQADTLRFVKDELEAAFEGKSWAEIAPELRANGRVRDVLDALPNVLGDEGTALRARIDRHVQALQDAHQAGVDAPRLGTAAREAEANTAAAMAARDAANDLRAKAGLWASQLERAGPKKASEIGLDVVEALRKAGRLTPAQAEERVAWLVRAGDNQAHVERVRRWVNATLAAVAVGAGGSGYLVAKGGQAANSAANLIEP